MSRAVAYPLIGEWRIVEADLWDRDYLDLVEPASITWRPLTTDRRRPDGDRVPFPRDCDVIHCRASAL